MREHTQVKNLLCVTSGSAGGHSSSRVVSRDTRRSVYATHDRKNDERLRVMSMDALTPLGVGAKWHCIREDTEAKTRFHATGAPTRLSRKHAW